jgi:hypothetical protein
MIEESSKAKGQRQKDFLTPLKYPGKIGFTPLSEISGIRETRYCQLFTSHFSLKRTFNE